MQNYASIIAQELNTVSYTHLAQRQAPSQYPRCGASETADRRAAGGLCGASAFCRRGSGRRQGGPLPAGRRFSGVPFGRGAGPVSYTHLGLVGRVVDIDGDILSIDLGSTTVSLGRAYVVSVMDPRSKAVKEEK